MDVKVLEANYDYNSRVDVINIEVKKEYEYEISIDLDVGVFLHFDKHYFPVGIEIIDASKKMNVNKDFLMSPSGNVEIIINNDRINVMITFENDNENGSMCFNALGESYIPNVETGFALI